MRPQTVRAANDCAPTAVMGVIRGTIGGVNYFRVPRPWPGGIWNAGTRDLRPYFAPRVPRHALLRTSGATARDPKKINCRPLSLRGGGGRCSCAAASLRQRLPLRGLRSLRSLRPLPQSASSCCAELASCGPLPLYDSGGGNASQRQAADRPLRRRAFSRHRTDTDGEPICAYFVSFLYHTINKTKE